MQFGNLYIKVPHEVQLMQLSPGEDSVHHELYFVLLGLYLLQNYVFQEKLSLPNFPRGTIETGVRGIGGNIT